MDCSGGMFDGLFDEMFDGMVDGMFGGMFDGMFDGYILWHEGDGDERALRMRIDADMVRHK